MESKGMIVAVVMLVIGLGVGLGGGYFLGYDLGYAAGYEPPAEPEDDYDRIVADGTMIVGTNSGWPPFEMVNATTGDLYGFDIDLAELCADYIGVTITWVDMDFDSRQAANPRIVTPQRYAPRLPTSRSGKPLRCRVPKCR